MANTTLLDLDHTESEPEPEPELELDPDMEPTELSALIYNMELPLSARLHTIDHAYQKFPSEIMEHIRTLQGMYGMSGASALETYLFALVDERWLPILGRLECLKCLLEYSELHSTDRKSTRSRLAWSKLEEILRSPESETVPTPYKMELIFILSDSPYNVPSAIAIYRQILTCPEIEEPYRYKFGLLGLEARELQKLREDDVLQAHLTNETKSSYIACGIKLQTSSGKPVIDPKAQVSDGQYFRLLQCIGQPFPKIDFLIQGGYAFFQASTSWKDSNTKFGVLSGQYVLQKIGWVLEGSSYNELDTATLQMYQAYQTELHQTLLEKAKDPQIPYNTRADCADVLLGVGDAQTQLEAKQIIRILGQAESAPSIYHDAQNVHHSSQMEASIYETIQKVLDLTDNSKLLSSEEVRTQIEAYLQTGENENLDQEAIHRALDRIAMDRMLYSQYSYTISNVLCILYSYICNSSYKPTLLQRLLQELEEMSDTCSMGYLGRLCNVLSGYDGFALTISYPEQIAGNVAGRINAYIREIRDDPEHSFWKTHYTRIQNICPYRLKYNTRTRAKIHSWYVDQVYQQMTELESDYYARSELTFLLQSYIPSLHAELYAEFVDSELMGADLFEAAFREALVKYTVQ